MVDIHSHILPNVDDGAGSLEEAVEMAKLAAVDGTHTIIATPHAADGRYNSEPQRVLESVSRLNLVLQQHDVPLTVCCGQEIRVNSSTLDDLMEHRVLPLNNGSYVLLELPSRIRTGEIEELIHEMKLLGHIPIIAHPERNASLLNDSELLYRFITCGALSQVNASSVTGANGNRIRKAAMQFLRRGLVQFIASDTHNTTSRVPGLQAAYRRIALKLGREKVQELIGNSLSVLNDLPMERCDPSPVSRKWFTFTGIRDE